MLRCSLAKVILGISFATLATAASAVPVDFTVTGGSASVSGLGIGSTLTITPSAGLAHSFSLDGGSSHSFDFLDFTLSGLGGVAGVVDATLGFSDPLATSADGMLAGLGIIAFYVSGGGLAVVNDPSPIAFGSGGLFDVDFTGFTTGCTLCTSLSGTVRATVSLLRAPTSVPEPGPLALLGAGLIAFGISRRKRT